MAAVPVLFLLFFMLTGPPILLAGTKVGPDRRTSLILDQRKKVILEESTIKCYYFCKAIFKSSNHN